MDSVNPDVIDVNDLFDQGVQDDVLSREAARSIRYIDLNRRIRPALGVDIEQLAASEMVLITALIDDSASIRSSRAYDEAGNNLLDDAGRPMTNADLVREGQNQIIEQVLSESRGGEDITCHIRYLNPSVEGPNDDATDILCNYVLLSEVPRLTESNYSPRGRTPLYDQLAVVLATAQAEMLRYMQLNMPCRSIIYIITDGADYGSTSHRPSSVRPIVQSLLAQEDNIVCAMGIRDDVGTDFRRVFMECGIPEEWILTSGNTSSDIRRAFGLVSRSVSRASLGVTRATSFEWDN